MPAFEYVVLDPKGRQKKGTLEGDSARQVRQQLREEGLVPLSVDPTVKKVSTAIGEGGERAGSGFSLKSWMSQTYSLSALDLALLTRQMATLVQAGLPVEHALQAMAKQTQKPKVRSMILSVRSKIVEGYTLADGLAEFPKAFPNIYRATVAAGEHSGHLDLVLEQLADYTESSHDTNKKIKGAMIYPVVLTLFSLLIVVGMLNFVVPKMVSVFESSGQTLPGLTRGLIALSEWLQQYGVLLLMLIVAAVFLFRHALKKKSFRYWVHMKVLSMPLLGRITRAINASRVANTLSILSQSGVQLVEALKIAAQVVTNVCMQRAVDQAAVLLQEGTSLHKALDQSNFFPPMMIQMIASGESSGELEAMLSRSALAQERELQGLIGTLVSLFEPLMMVVMGAVVLTIVLAIMLPVISMNTLVN